MKKIMHSRAVTALLFLLALVLLSVGTIGGTQAALSIRSRDYDTSFDMDHIGVALWENGGKVAERTFQDVVNGKPIEPTSKDLTLDLGNDAEILIGKQYPFSLQAENTGTIDEYVRISVWKYWVDKDGNKITDNSYLPRHILLDYQSNTDVPERMEDSYNTSAWLRDESAHTDERDIYYYRSVLVPEAFTDPLFSHMSASKYTAKDAIVETSTDNNVTKTVYRYAYNDCSFVVEVVVDVVQTHHAAKAINSAWGTNGTVISQLGISAE